ncbi:MAG: COX15/CtaA family protein [Gemmatimonadota bacterium]|nr:MAG: COX15/CtaA family protein [Gemmatimonadota bacterium]
MSDLQENDRKTAGRFATLAFVTAGFTYALIVFGGVVRITGSGMGCGDDWPLCNGQLIPPLDFETLIEYGHRLAAALVGLLVLLVAGHAVKNRNASGIAGRGIAGLAVAALLLLIVQVLVGAITVKLELPTSTVVLHLALASTLLATLLIAGLRARGAVPSAAEPGRTPSHTRWALASAALGFVALLFGGLVANTGAAPLCQGFPLCNGQVMPEGGSLVHLHWTHRLLGYALVLLVAIAVLRTRTQVAGKAIFGSALLAAGLVVVQIAVAAAMVLLSLPPVYRALHLAVGAALWGVLVVWATVAARQPAPAPAG